MSSTNSLPRLQGAYGKKQTNFKKKYKWFKLKYINFNYKSTQNGKL